MLFLLSTRYVHLNATGPAYGLLSQWPALGLLLLSLSTGAFLFRALDSAGLPCFVQLQATDPAYGLLSPVARTAISTGAFFVSGCCKSWALRPFHFFLDSRSASPALFSIHSPEELNFTHVELNSPTLQEHKQCRPLARLSIDQQTS